MTPVGQVYSAQGPISVQSVLTTLILGTIVAVVGGLAVWGWELSPIPTLVILTPLLQGLVVGLALAFMIGRLHMRNPKLLAVIGFLCGLASIFMVHYGHYVHSVYALKSELETELQSDPALKPADKAIIQEKVAKDPAGMADELFFVPRTGHGGFVGSMLFRNQIGVKIKNSDLTGTGLWILWGFEALMVAGFAGYMASSRAAKPYCEDCSAWCEEKVAPIVIPPEAAPALAEAVRVDDLNRFVESHAQARDAVVPLEAEVPPKKPSKTIVTTTSGSTLHSCPGCDQTFADLWIKTDTTKGKKTETKTQHLLTRLRISPEMAALLRQTHQVDEPELVDQPQEPAHEA